MSELDLSKATDAARQALFEARLKWQAGVVDTVIRAALPHILDALAEAAAKERDARFARFDALTSVMKGFAEGTFVREGAKTANQAHHWLRAKAAEVRGG